MKIVLSLIAVLVSTSAFAYTGLDNMSAWESDYISGKGQITVRVHGASRCGDGKDKVSIVEDRNSCFLNDLGLPAGCTRMGFESIEGSLKKLAVEADKRTSVYEVEGTEYRIVTEVVSIQPLDVQIKRVLKVKDGRVVDAVSVQRNFALEPQIEPLPPGHEPRTRCF